MTTTMIIDSIAAWQGASRNSEQLVTWLEQGNCFTYDNISYAEVSDYIHAYPGVYEGELYFFMIPEAYDKEEYAASLSDYVQACPVMWSLLGTNTIPDLVAEIRIDRWIKEYKTWVPKQVDMPDGIFLAFNIPAIDFESEECLITLGLQHNTEEILDPTADLVIANSNSKTLIQFDDFVKPVPPYSPVAAAEDFYLLQAASS